MKYGFDHVFSETSTQSQVYEKTALPLIDTVLEGYNATLFAYGATGCGMKIMLNTRQDSHNRWKYRRTRNHI